MPGILLMTLCIILLNFTMGTNLIYILIIRRQAGVIKVAQLIMIEVQIQKIVFN